MPRDKPRYLMGVGTPYDLLAAIGSGIDMFDCVLPTRNARNGQALTWHGRVNIKQARHTEDQAPLDARCGCPVCARFTRAYLRHLFNAEEMLGPRLMTRAQPVVLRRAHARGARAPSASGATRPSREMPPSRCSTVTSSAGRSAHGARSLRRLRGNEGLRQGRFCAALVNLKVALPRQ